MRPKIKNLAFATLSVSILLLAGFPTSSAAFDFPVWLCNEGDADLYYGVLATSSGFIGFDASAEIAGIYKIAPGKRYDINRDDYDLLAIALFQYDSNDNLVNVQYKLDNVGKWDSTMDWICLKPGGETKKKGTKSAIVKEYTPPCSEGHIKASTSFYINSSHEKAIYLEIAATSIPVVSLGSTKAKAKTARSTLSQRAKELAADRALVKLKEAARNHQAALANYVEALKNTDAPSGKIKCFEEAQSKARLAYGMFILAVRDEKGGLGKEYYRSQGSRRLDESFKIYDEATEKGTCSHQ